MVALAKDVLINEDEARKRTVYLAGAVFHSLIESAIQENRKMVPEVDRYLFLRLNDLLMGNICFIFLEEHE